ncbi:MAG: iron-sulfur cluster biosynthesis protein [Enterococcus lacertideformus]|uniref:Iron-sulfur cluster biosynthesis protein n=1 Tax=Enterococcus lacertideformus TaxID=2771493 RepID=A0A931FCF7_9ENTE|nr:iron-sulfur cluster biosynthesis protein [Enterococcus lacertideformus]
MELSVTANARKWFAEEVVIPENYGIRFFGKIYGKTEVHEGFSIGMSVEQPEQPIKKEIIDDMLFFIEEADEWFFKGYDLEVDYDSSLNEPTYHFNDQ